MNNINNINENFTNINKNFTNLNNIIYDYNNINNDLINEGINLLVICFGGCCSNSLVDILEKNGYKIRTKLFDKILCHSPETFDTNIPIIYLYNNPIEAYLSQKRRKIELDINNKSLYQININKLSNNYNTIISDKNLLNFMIKQFYKWKDYLLNKKNNNIIFLHKTELFRNTIKKKLNKFLNKKLIGFPLIYKKPKTNYNLIDENDKILFIKYKNDIDYINNFRKLY